MCIWSIFENIIYFLSNFARSSNFENFCLTEHPPKPFFVGSYLKFVCEMFILVLEIWFLLAFRNSILYSQNRILFALFWFFTKLLACAGWVNWEIILSHTLSYCGKYFIADSSQTNFRVCSVGVQILTILSRHPNTRSASVEQISSLSE